MNKHLLRCGRNNLALTVFVPFDCKNSCSFCTSKKEYHCHKPNFKEVERNLYRMVWNSSDCDIIKDIVFTGGEPLADISILDTLISTLPDRLNIFINTTLPKDSVEEFYSYLDTKNGKRISGISVSRHTSSYKTDCQGLHDIATDEQIYMIAEKVNTRINVVLNNDTNIEEIVNRWNDCVAINLREDYRHITNNEMLHSPYTDRAMALVKKYDFVKHTSCEVCDTICYKFGEKNIYYHRGLPKTYIIHQDYDEYNDIVIWQDGVVSFDWDRKHTILEKSDPDIVPGIYSLPGSGCGGRNFYNRCYKEEQKIPFYSYNYPSEGSCGGESYGCGYSNENLFCGGGGC